MNNLKNQVRNKYQVPIHKKLLSNYSKTLFYTGFETQELFTKLHDFIAPFVKKNYHGYKNLLKYASKLKRNFIIHQKNGNKKLESKIITVYD